MTNKQKKYSSLIHKFLLAVFCTKNPAFVLDVDALARRKKAPRSSKFTHFLRMPMRKLNASRYPGRRWKPANWRLRFARIRIRCTQRTCSTLSNLVQWRVYDWTRRTRLFTTSLILARCRFRGKMRYTFDGRGRRLNRKKKFAIYLIEKSCFDFFFLIIFMNFFAKITFHFSGKFFFSSTKKFKQPNNLFLDDRNGVLSRAEHFHREWHDSSGSASGWRRCGRERQSFKLVEDVEFLFEDFSSKGPFVRSIDLIFFLQTRSNSEAFSSSIRVSVASDGSTTAPNAAICIYCWRYTVLGQCGCQKAQSMGRLQSVLDTPASAPLEHPNSNNGHAPPVESAAIEQENHGATVIPITNIAEGALTDKLTNGENSRNKIVSWFLTGNFILE